MNRLSTIILRLEQYQTFALPFVQQHKPTPKWLKQAIRTAYNEYLDLRFQARGAAK